MSVMYVWYVALAVYVCMLWMYVWYVALAVYVCCMYVLFD